MAAKYKVRKFEDLPKVIQAAARSAWNDAHPGDEWLYKTYAGALIERFPSPKVLTTEYCRVHPILYPSP